MTGPGGEGKLKKIPSLPSFFVPAFNKSLLLKATSPKGGLTLRSIHSIKVHSFPFKKIFGSFVQKKKVFLSNWRCGREYHYLRKNLICEGGVILRIECTT